MKDKIYAMLIVLMRGSKYPFEKPFYESHLVKKYLRQFAVEACKNPKVIFESHDRLREKVAISLLSDLMNFQSVTRTTIIYQ